MHSDLTTGSITGTMLRFALPMITGNLLQQFYNIADTLIVGRYLGVQALAPEISAEPKKQASQKKTDACSFYRERIFYFNRANASLMRHIASIIFSSEVA